MYHIIHHHQTLTEFLDFSFLLVFLIVTFKWKGENTQNMPVSNPSRKKSWKVKLQPQILTYALSNAASVYPESKQIIVTKWRIIQVALTTNSSLSNTQQLLCVSYLKGEHKHIHFHRVQSCPRAPVTGKPNTRWNPPPLQSICTCYEWPRKVESSLLPHQQVLSYELG